MNTIQINYDLKKPGRNYEPLYDYLKSYATRCPLLDSCWLVRTTKSASQVRDELKDLVDRNDEVATFNVTGCWWATNWTDKRTDWLHNNMGHSRAA
jgi:hypothetical protein